ncbi:MAG TPA: hypothetical protein VG738_04630 [Chitinophagaceae bacterium]|nr:hypothetical protein [Chitinophagaceae bacterium]
MLLLLIDSALLLFITLGLGMLTLRMLERLLNCAVNANILGVFLAGLLLSTIYFNILSFWWPVNFYCLLPLFILACITTYRLPCKCSQLLTSAKQQLSFIFRRRNLVFTIPVLLFLFYYWIIPPINSDSADYHYITIAWYEKYRVIPGLANIHGRLAFNPASFIIQAAYSFTALTGQAIYPLNGVLTALCLLWLLKRILQTTQTITGFIYLVLFIILTRVLLLNISSPSSDTLFIVCLVYAFIKIYDGFCTRRPGLPQFILPALLLIYSVTAKLAAFPALLVLPLLLYFLRTQKLLPVVTKITLVSLLIYIPWLCRNIILSGYLVYPLYQLDIFNFDWETPKHVLELETGYIKTLSALFSLDIGYVQSLSFPAFLAKWFIAQFHAGRPLNFAIFIPAIISPVYWLAGLKQRRKIPVMIFALWFIIYAAIWLWLYNSPEYRFGITFLAFAIVLPWLAMKDFLFIRQYKLVYILSAVIILISTTLYFVDGYNKPSGYAFTLRNCWLYPLKDKQYFTRNDTATFKYQTLANGVKVYIPDSLHACLNAPHQPCIMIDYGAVIEARGPKMEDGFRMVSDSIPQLFPGVK